MTSQKKNELQSRNPRTETGLVRNEQGQRSFSHLGMDQKTVKTSNWTRPGLTQNLRVRKSRLQSRIGEIP